MKDLCDKFQETKELTRSTFLAIHWNFEKDFKDACDKKKEDFYCSLKPNSTSAFQGENFFDRNYVKRASRFIQSQSDFRKLRSYFSSLTFSRNLKVIGLATS